MAHCSVDETFGEADGVALTRVMQKTLGNKLHRYIVGAETQKLLLKSVAEAYVKGLGQVFFEMGYLL